jgi:integrase
MRDKTWQPEDILRRALKRAGIVTSYTDVCRRKTRRFAEERGDCELRPCPKCGYKLWPKGNVRHLRFHDLRGHLRERAPHARREPHLGAEAPRALRPKITERRYGHLLPDFMKSEEDRLRFGLDSTRTPPTLGERVHGSAQGEKQQRFARGR